MKINNRIELQNIGIDYSADIVYNNFMKIYKKYTKNLLIFSQKILRYQQMILYDLGKICLNLYKIDSN